MSTLQAVPSRVQPRRRRAPPTLRRAPPLRLGAAAALEVDHATARHRLARRTGLAAGLVWTGVLFATLWALGRVPLPEAGLWSLLSGALLWRTLSTALRTIMERFLGDASIELGMRDPMRARAALHAALGRRGYAIHRHDLVAQTFQARRARWLLQPLYIAWSGPGAIVTGPRWLVRLVARIAVG